MKKILKIILFIIQGVLVFIVYGALTTASVKNIEKIVLVEQFKNKAVYQEQLSTNTLKFSFLNGLGRDKVLTLLLLLTIKFI